MKVTNLLPLSLILLLWGGGASAAIAADPYSRLDQSAADALAAGDYKKADSQWHKLLDRLNLVISRNGETKVLSEQVEATLRHLGENALAQKNYDSADDYFKQARVAANTLQEQDAELDRDVKDLAVNYRQIDLTNLGNLGIIGPIVTAALNDFHPNKVSVARTDSGHHVSVLLADDVVKEIGAKGVTQVGVSKNLSFDLIQGEGGAITLANITGIRVHAGFWVNIINSSLKLDESQRPVALVTAQKMGISQSVSTNVPDMIYLPMVAIVSQVKGLFGDEGSRHLEVTGAPVVTSSPPAGSSPAAVSGESTVTAPYVNAGASGNAAGDAGALSAQGNGSATGTVPANDGTQQQQPAGAGLGPGFAPATSTTSDTVSPVIPLSPAPTGIPEQAN